MSVRQMCIGHREEDPEGSLGVHRNGCGSGLNFLHWILFRIAVHLCTVSAGWKSLSVKHFWFLVVAWKPNSGLCFCACKLTLLIQWTELWRLTEFGLQCLSIFSVSANTTFRKLCIPLLSAAFHSSFWPSPATIYSNIHGKEYWSGGFSFTVIILKYIEF
jgi:hypothetical protein